MNKYSKYFAIAASVALVGCSNEGANDAPVNPAEGETAYMKVALRDANGGRAEEGEFLYGEGMEGHAANAQFFFFNADGVYMGQSNYTPINGSKPNNDPNIEFTGDAVVVLENIKSKDAPTYPNYMITLVNCSGEFPDDMLKGKTMQWFSEQISNWGEGDAEEGRFRMSSTSYFNGDVKYTDHNDDYYYATALSSDNFARTPELALAQTKPVKVFVERLAARVSLTCKEIFEVNATVAGMENGVVGVPEVPEAATKLYVRIDGWGLNGTCPESHISKQLTEWSADKTFETSWEFNAPGNRRSYWGQSTLYGTKYDEATFATNLKFFPAKDLKNPVTTVLYCNENTNSKDALKLENGLPNQRLLTSATITATVGTKDAEGNFVPADLVEHNGVYFEKDAFVAYVLGMLDYDKKLRYYTRTQAGAETEEGVLTDGEYAYKQVDASMFDIDGDNKAVYVVKGESFPTEQLYTYTLNDKNERVWAETDAATLAKDLKNATKDLKTIGFKGGQMTYNIPIAHENTKKYDETTNDLTEWYEASFGVVRNHAYQIKVNSIKRLGNGVFNPDDATDPVIPDEDPKDPNWYMGAEINILSWKIVNNSVDL